MSYELTGKMLEKYNTVSRSETFRTREFVIEKTDEINGKSIVNYIKFQCVQDRTAIVDNVNVGDMVKVYFNIKGSRWEKDGKVNFITNLDAWRLEQLLKPENQSQNSFNQEPHETSFSAESDADDLPF